MVNKHNKRSRPIYIQISESIRSKIIHSELKPGDQLPAIKSLAKEYGVSLVTASRAVNELKNQQIITTKWGGGCYVADQGNLHKTQFIATLAKGNDRSIHYDRSLETYWEQIFSQSILGVQEQCAREKIKNQNILIPESMIYEEVKLTDYLNQQLMDVDGIICIWQGLNSTIAHRLQEFLNKPVIFNDFSLMTSTDFNTVQIDLYDLTCKIMKHLNQKGHARIACIAGKNETDPGYRFRLKAYKNYLANKRMNRTDIYYAEDKSQSITETCNLFLDEFQHKNITAVFCFNDYRAMTLMELAKQRHISLPEELAIVGFDGTEKAIEMGLTTIQLPFYQVGREAVMMLEDLINNRLKAPIQKRISTGIIYGKSTDSNLKETSS